MDEIEGDLVTVNTGDVWSFTAIPIEAYAPNPADGARNVMRDIQLSWLPASGAILHDAYLGTSRDDVAAGTGDTFKDTLSELTFDPGLREGDTSITGESTRSMCTTPGLPAASGASTRCPISPFPIRALSVGGSWMKTVERS